MIGVIATGTLTTAEISAVIHKGLNIKLSDGRIGKLAILDDVGRIIDDNPAIAGEVWLICIACYKNFLIGNGHLRVYSEPLPGIAESTYNRSNRSA